MLSSPRAGWQIRSSRRQPFIFVPRSAASRPNHPFFKTMQAPICRCHNLLMGFTRSFRLDSQQLNAKPAMLKSAWCESFASTFLNANLL